MSNENENKNDTDTVQIACDLLARNPPYYILREL